MNAKWYYVKQSHVEILRQRLYQIMAGYEDCNDADSLRDDPVFKGIAGRLPSDDALASQPTLSRFENGVTVKELYRVALYLLKVYLGSKKVPPSRVIVDIDTTDADRLSCHRFVANQFRLLLHAAAYVLLHALKKYLQGTKLENAQISTIRCQLLKIGTQVVQSCRRLWVHLASGYPLQTLFWTLSQRLSTA